LHLLLGTRAALARQSRRRHQLCVDLATRPVMALVPTVTFFGASSQIIKQLACLCLQRAPVARRQLQQLDFRFPTSATLDEEFCQRESHFAGAGDLIEVCQIVAILGGGLRDLGRRTTFRHLLLNSRPLLR
jgi:hypothetical protein